MWQDRLLRLPQANFLCVLTSQLEKSNSCAIVLNDFNNCKNSEYFLRVL